MSFEVLDLVAPTFCMLITRLQYRCICDARAQAIQANLLALGSISSPVGMLVFYILQPLGISKSGRRKTLEDHFCRRLHQPNWQAHINLLPASCNIMIGPCTYAALHPTYCLICLQSHCTGCLLPSWDQANLTLYDCNCVENLSTYMGCKRPAC